MFRITVQHILKYAFIVGVLTEPVIGELVGKQIQKCPIQGLLSFLPQNFMREVEIAAPYCVLLCYLYSLFMCYWCEDVIPDKLIIEHVPFIADVIIQAGFIYILQLHSIAVRCIEYLILIIFTCAIYIQFNPKLDGLLASWTLWLWKAHLPYVGLLTLIHRVAISIPQGKWGYCSIALRL